MPAPFAKRISAIEAPVCSLRHSIFSETPFSDFSRQGRSLACSSTSSRLGIAALRASGFRNRRYSRSSCDPPFSCHVIRGSGPRPRAASCARIRRLRRLSIWARTAFAAASPSPLAMASAIAECSRDARLAVEGLPQMQIPVADRALVQAAREIAQHRVFGKLGEFAMEGAVGLDEAFELRGLAVAGAGARQRLQRFGILRRSHGPRRCAQGRLRWWRVNREFSGFRECCRAARSRPCAA